MMIIIVTVSMTKMNTYDDDQGDGSDYEGEDYEDDCGYCYCMCVVIRVLRMQIHNFCGFQHQLQHP